MLNKIILQKNNEIHKILITFAVSSQNAKPFIRD